MVRVSRPSELPPNEIAGLIERLGTGEKQAFRGAVELLRLLTDWDGRSTS
jgi:hypothetical protein